MEGNVLQAVAEGWTMKNVPRVGEGGDWISCVIICFVVIAVVIIYAFIAGWFGQ